MIYDTDFHPELIHESVWIADGARIVGEVHLAENVSVWLNAVLRGDTEKLTIGPGTNIQDGCVLHADPGFPLVLGSYVTIGHNAIVHGAIVGDNALIGMGAVVLNGANIGENCIVGAGALVTQNKQFPPNSMILGSPAKVVRELTDDEIKMNRASAQHYIDKAQQFKQARENA